MADKYACTIVIDTNQFFADWFLNAARWHNLIDYIKKTDATLIFPEIIWREIGENCISEAQKKQKAAYQSLQNYFSHRNFRMDISGFRHLPPKIDTIELTKSEDWENIKRAYLAWLKDKLLIDKRQIIPFKHQWFEKITERAVKHIKPFNQDSDKGFKDSIMWLTMLDLRRRSGFSENPIVLISSNTKDFSDGITTTKLHNDLVIEAKLNNLDIHFFKSLDAFLDDWPKNVLSNHKRIFSEITPNFLKDKIFELAKFEVRNKGFNITSKDLEVTSLNYYSY